MVNRVKVAGLGLSAAALVGILLSEGYRDRAYQPVPNDRITIGFGTTEGVKPHDRITPPKALTRALTDVQKFEGAVKQCVRVPLYQNEYDSYISLSYNIGSKAFCGSTLVKKLNARDYAGACREILNWVYFKGRRLRGLEVRRQGEYQTCMGGKS